MTAVSQLLRRTAGASIYCCRLGLIGEEEKTYIDKVHDSAESWGLEYSALKRFADCRWVVQLFNGTRSFCPVIALQRYDCDLFDVIEKAQGGLSDDDARCFGEQMLDAVHYLHCMGVYHRDIKPENFLIKGRRLCLCDFEMCTESAFVYPGKGTRQYLSLEALGCRKYQTRSADVWALAVALFIVLFSFPPYQEECIPTHDLRCRLQSILDDKAVFWSRIWRWNTHRSREASKDTKLELLFNSCFVVEMLSPDLKEIRAAYSDLF
jgi:serine/threonine protein kinase